MINCFVCFFLFVSALCAVDAVAQARRSYSSSRSSSSANVQTDSQIETSVRAALNRAMRSQLVDLYLSVSRGSVRLSGRVKTETEKARASSIYRSVKGVKSVDNRLRVSN